MTAAPRRRVLVVCFDPVGPSMAGPAIRAWHLALELAADAEVTLVSTVAADRSHPAIEVRRADGAELDALAAGVDAVVAPTSVARRHPGVVAGGVPLAVDLSIPTHLENLQAAGRGADRHAADVARQVAIIDEDLAAGDFFVCSSERQRDFWLGALASAGRVSPATAGADPTLRSLIDVVAFGLPGEPPTGSGHPLRATFGIPADHPVLIWGGGVYDWLDPLVAVRATDALRGRFPDIHLVFLGLRNPNPAIAEMAVVGELRRLCDELGLTGTHVHLHEGWVPYEERGAWLVDADVALSMHGDHLETRFSFRTRVLDYLWARRPMVLTGGDELAAVVAAAGLGVAVAPGDVDAVVAGVTALLTDPPAPGAWEPVLAAYRWSVVAAPLRRWAAAAAPAADRPAASLPAVPDAPTVPAGGADAVRRAAAEARAERVAPGYLARVRDAAGRLAVGPDPRGDLRAALGALEGTATADVDVPTLSRRAPVRVLKKGVKGLTAFYLRYLGQQVTALGHATAAFGREVVERTDALDRRQDATAARLAALEEHVARLEAGAGPAGGPGTPDA